MGICTLQFAQCRPTSECWADGKFTTYNKKSGSLSSAGDSGPAIAEARATPPASKQANKCTMSDADCGLLNDNMAVFWGEVKDKYDAKMAELTQAKHHCKEVSTTINEEITLWNALLQERNADLGEATGEQSEATQTQTDKQREQRELSAEYKEIDKKCKDTVGTIMANLCGLRKVRGELATFSKTVKPDQIVDCVTTDWSPSQCSKSCDTGRQMLSRDVSQPTSNGIKCPPLQMVKRCNQFPCPINCKVSDWSGWGRCSKECGGGMQARVRTIDTRPDFGGEACPPQTETQQCNAQSCDRDCTLSEWTKWAPCTKACGKGSQRRIKKVTVKAAGNGKCPKALNHERYERQACNTNECPPDPQCSGKMDIVLVVDSSGSWTEKGYNVVKAFVTGLTKMYDLDRKKVKLGIVEFSKEAHIIQGMTYDKNEVEKSLANLKFRKGLTDMAKGLLTAEKLLLDGRKDSQSEVIVITDGKPSFKFATSNAARKLNEHGARLVFMPIRTYGKSPFLLKWATAPGKENVFRVPGGLAELKAKMEHWQTTLLVSTCPTVSSAILAAHAAAEAAAVQAVQEPSPPGATSAVAVSKHKVSSDPFSNLYDSSAALELA